MNTGGPIDLRAILTETVRSCRQTLSDLTARIQAEIDAAQLAGDTVRRDALIDLLSDVTEAILVLNRQQIVALDDQLQPLNEQLAPLTQSMKDRMAHNRKIAEQLHAFAGIIGGVTSVGGQIFGAG